MNHIDHYLLNANSLRFKLWAIVGRDELKKQNIISYLEAKGYQLVDVGSALQPLYDELLQQQEVSYDVGQRLNDWIDTLPEKLILTNAGLLYENTFGKLNPIGTFKYNSRNRSCVLFLDTEQLLKNRLYYGQVGQETYTDQDVNDILTTRIQDIEENYQPIHREVAVDYKTQDELPSGAIGRLFQYTTIKDVVDIDSDLRGDDSRRELVSSYIVSETLESQIIDFFDNLQQPNHKAVKIVGNYGSGKSHLIAFLVSIINYPKLRDLIQNAKVRDVANRVGRLFFTVRFELNPVDVDLSHFFFKELEKQIHKEYGIQIPRYIPGETLNFKDHLTDIIETLKAEDPVRGLLVVMDEVSDFVQTKQNYQIKRDFQFLRVVAQVCQDQDLLLVTSMQEDIYSSPKLQNIAADEDRISQRFQNIIIRREAVRTVIARRIVPKTAQHQADLETLLIPFRDKIEDVANKMGEYVDLFPFTPALLTLFDELPYFEKRGVIQFAQRELKYALDKPFPYFFTFDRIFDLLADNPNVRNLEGVFDIVKVVRLIEQKIELNLDRKLHDDARKLLKGLAIYSIWSRGNNGATAKELAEQLLILPQSKALEAYMQVSLIIKRIRDATDGFYIKVVKDDTTGNDYFKFDPAIDGHDPEERIEHEKAAVGDDTDRLEAILFDQIREITNLVPYQNLPNVFVDECLWPSVKSFRRGLVVFRRQGQESLQVPQTDYVICFVSPYSIGIVPTYAPNQLTIYLKVGGQENVELLKRIAGIQSLISKNVLTSVMSKKLMDAYDGHRRTDGGITPGIKFRLAKWVQNLTETNVNGEPISVPQILGKEYTNLSEVVQQLKSKVFDSRFNEQFPAHPRYTQQLTSANINSSLSTVALDVVKGDSTQLTVQNRSFLNTLGLLNANGDFDISSDKVTQWLLATINAKGGKVVDIDKELVASLRQVPYGIEPEVVQLLLIVLTTLGRVSLKGRGGDELDIANIRDKFKSLSQFENIPYAQKKDDLSWDFASALLNALGLNGAKVLQEATRNAVFQEYKNKVAALIQLNSNIQTAIYQLESRSNLFIDTNAVASAFRQTQVVDWNTLNIANPAQFTKIESLNAQLPAIRQASLALDTLNRTISDYNRYVHTGLVYMDEALAIVTRNDQYLTTPKLADRLRTLHEDTMAVVKDFSQFNQLSDRQPLEGKIKSFKDGYIKEFYYPAHDKTIGNKVNWKPLESFDRNPLYERASELATLRCNTRSRLDQMAVRWRELLELRCLTVDVQRLYEVPFNTVSNFMKVHRDYAAIQSEADRVDANLIDIVADYEATALRETTAKLEQLPLINASDAIKNQIKDIATEQRMPAVLDPALLRAINQLFTDIQVVRLQRNEVIQELFKPHQLMTLGDLQQALTDFQSELAHKYRGQEVRIQFD